MPALKKDPNPGGPTTDGTTIYTDQWNNIVDRVGGEANLIANRAIATDANGNLEVQAVTKTELGYLSGCLSNIQTQLNGKAASSHTHTLADITDDGALAAKNTVATADIDNDAVTYAKIQNVSATDKVLGRATAGAGDVEEIACTAAGRALIDDADAATQRTTLGLGALATKATVGVADIDNDAVTYAKIQNVATDRLLGRDTIASGDIEELTVGGGIEFTGIGGIQTSAFTGDVTKTAGSTATTIANNAVSDAKLRDSAGVSVIGRSTGTTGDPADIAASADGQYLTRRSGALSFASIQIADLPVGSAYQRIRTNSGATSLENFDDVASITFIIDGGGSAITTGVKGDLEIPFACIIQQATLLADQTGSIVIDIWKDTYANYPPTIADTITASAKPTITSAAKSQDGTLTGWTTSITAGDTLRFNVDSATTITRVTLSLKVKKT